MPAINIWAVLIATIASQLIGFVWYSVIFSEPWARGYRLEPDALASTPPLSYVATILGAFVYSLALAVGAGLLDITGLPSGIVFGAIVWAGIVLPRYLLHALFARIAAGSALIDLAFDLILSIVAGAIIGVWLPT